MSIIKRYSPLLNLSDYQTFIVDDTINSKYFRISEINDTLTAGKNGFLIEGSPHLKETTELKLEVLDVEGNPVYIEPGRGFPVEYYEGTSILVSIYVYDETPIGIGTITVLGEAKTYINSNGVEAPIPEEWQGSYNIKWERDIKINKLLLNEDKVRFYQRPLITINEIVKPIFDVAIENITQSGSVIGIPQIPTTNTDLSTWTAGTEYQLYTADTFWTSSIIGNPIDVDVAGEPYAATVIEVLNNKNILVDLPYTENNIVLPFTSSTYTSSFDYNEEAILTPSELTGSFANIQISRLRTFVGDVARVKIFRKSRNDVGDFQLLQDLKLESSELLVDLTATGSNEITYGIFNDSNLDTYWVTGSNDHPISIDNEVLQSSVFVDYNTVSGSVQTLETTSSIDILKDVEYTLSFKCKLNGTVDASKTLKAYLSSPSGSQTFVEIEATNDYLHQVVINENIIGYQDDSMKLVFEFEGDDWYISNVSLQNAAETSFSPDAVRVIQTMPRILQEQIFDFRFEFYDINNNYIPVDVHASHTFNLGNVLGGQQGEDGIGFTPEFYYIRPVNGTQIKNSSGSLELQTVAISGSLIADVASGSVQMYSGSTLLNTGMTGVTSGSNGVTYNPIFDSSAISGSLIITLKSGSQEYDSITLIDTLDGIPAGSIIANQLFTRRISGSNAYDPMPLEVTASFYNAAGDEFVEYITLSASFSEPLDYWHYDIDSDNPNIELVCHNGDGVYYAGPGSLNKLPTKDINTLFTFTEPNTGVSLTAQETFYIVSDGRDGFTPEFFQIQPLDGTQIKNSTGSLELKAVAISGSTVLDVTVSSFPNVKMYSGSVGDYTELSSAMNGISDGVNGAAYNPIFDASAITGSFLVTLRNNTDDVDTIKLIDVTDGIPAGSIIANQRTTTRTNGTTFYTPTELFVTASFFNADGDEFVEYVTLTPTFTDPTDYWHYDIDLDNPNIELECSDVDGGIYTTGSIAGKKATKDIHAIFTFTEPNTGVVIKAQETFLINSNGIDGFTPEFYQIQPLSGSQIKNSSGSLELQVIAISGSTTAKVNGGDIKLYSGSFELADTLTGISDGNYASSEYNPIIDETGINGTLLLTLKHQSTLDEYDSIALFDVTDGISGGSIIASNLRTHRNYYDTTYTPPSLSVTASFYDAHGNEFVEYVTLTPNFSDPTDYWYYDIDSDNPYIDLVCNDKDGVNYSGPGIGNKLPTKDISTIFTFTDPTSGNISTVEETFIIVADGKDGLSVEYFAIQPKNGTQLKNSTGTLELQAVAISGSSVTIITSGNYPAVQMYSGSTLLNVGMTDISAGSNGVTYNPIIGPDAIDGSLIITLKDGGTEVDTIALVDTGDGIPAGSIIASNLLTRRQNGTSIYTPTSLEVTASFYDVAGTEFVEYVTLTPNFSDPTDYWYYDIDTDNPNISLVCSAGNVLYTAEGIGGKKATKDINTYFTFTDPKSGAVLTAQETFYIISDGIDGTGSEFYYIKPLDGTQIKNSTGTLELQAVSISGSTAEDIIGGTVKLYSGSVILNTGMTGITDGGNGAEYNPIIAASAINGSLLITLKDGANPVDSISLLDVTDGLAGGSIIANSLKITRDKLDAYSPTSLAATASFYNAQGTEYVETFVITPNLVGSTDQLKYEVIIDNGNIAISVNDGDGNSMTDGNFANTKDINTIFTFTDPISGNTNTAQETFYIVSDGDDGLIGASGSDGVAISQSPPAQSVIFNGSTYGTPDTVTVNAIEAATTYTYDYVPAYANATFHIANIVGGTNNNNKTFTPNTPSSLAGTTVTFDVIYKTTTGLSVTSPQSHIVSVVSDGTDGTGTPGVDALKSTSGYVYYQTPQVGQPTQPSDNTVSPGGYNFTNFTFANLTAGWLQTPPAAEASGSYWVSRYTVNETAPAGTDYGIPSFTTASLSLQFNDIVTFTNLSDPNDTTTVIDGAHIQTGVIQSQNYTTGTFPYSSNGTQIDLISGSITSTYFAVDTTGSAYFSGSIHGGDITIGDNFSVTNSGQLFASGAILDGDITAETGTIGGWVLSQGSFNGGSGDLVLNSDRPAVEIYDNGTLAVDISTASTLSNFTGSLLNTTGSITTQQSASGLKTDTIAAWGAFTQYYDISMPAANPIASTQYIEFQGDDEVGNIVTLSAEPSASLDVWYVSWDNNSNMDLADKTIKVDVGLKIVRPNGPPIYQYVTLEDSDDWTANQGLPNTFITKIPKISVSFEVVAGSYKVFMVTKNGRLDYFHETTAANNFIGAVRSATLGSAGLTVGVDANKTEIVPGGFQVVKSSTQYLRADKNASDTGTGDAWLTSGGWWYHTGTFTQTSDVRQKYDISPITFDLKKLNDIDGYSYTQILNPKKTKDDKADKDYKEFKSTGLLAQEIEDIIPNAVYTSVNDIKSIDYSVVTATLVNIVKQLYVEIESLQSQIDNLKLK
jgi:hypothetical protein